MSFIFVHTYVRIHTSRRHICTHENFCFSFLQSEWEKATDKRIKSNTISRRVEKLMQRGTFSLEDRRERLEFIFKLKINKPKIFVISVPDNGN